jgi:hypothetical protein
VETTHLSATVDLADALEAAPEAQREQLQEQLDSFGAGADDVLATDMPVDVYIDGDGRVRRFEVAMEIPGAGDMNVTIDFSDFGDDVDIEVPDDSDVSDVSDRIGDLLGGGGS